jgi:hypothetical protein
MLLPQDISYNADKSLEDYFYEYEVKLNRNAFEQQFHYGAMLGALHCNLLRCAATRCTVLQRTVLQHAVL